METIPSKIEQNLKLKFALLAPAVWEALSNLKRTGWVERGVKNPESVQEHTIALRKIAASFTDLLEKEKEELLDMLEVHDWPEAIAGDQVILSSDEKELASLKASKFEQERQALISICENLGEKGKEIINLWLRFETASDETASFARQLDKYQAIEKALEYEKAQGIPLFKEFFDYSKKNITHPILLKRLQKLQADWENK